MDEKRSGEIRVRIPLAIGMANVGGRRRSAWMGPDIGVRQPKDLVRGATVQAFPELGLALDFLLGHADAKCLP